MVHGNDKDTCLVAQAFDCIWLSCYLHPLHCIHDQGMEFMVFEFQELLDSYGICSTVKNPTANAVLEFMCQTMSNMIVQWIYKQLISSWWMKLWMSLLHLFVLHAGYHTSMKAAPTHLVFKIFFPTTYVANCHQQQTQEMVQIEKENEHEHHNHILPILLVLHPKPT
jgi:hypothetical protein